MLRQYNSDVEEQEKNRGIAIKQALETNNPVFNAICQAARNQNKDEAQRILDEHRTLDIYSDGSEYSYITDVRMGSSYAADYTIDLYHYHLMKITPIALLAYEGNHEGVNLLVQLGANYYFALYGYAYAGNIDKVNQIMNSLYQSYKNLLNKISVAGIFIFSACKFTGADSALAIPKGLRNLMSGSLSSDHNKSSFDLTAMRFAISGYNDTGYLSSQDNILKLFALMPSNLRRCFANKLTQEEFKFFDSKANHINKLRDQYQLEYEQALIWMIHSELYMWFLMGIQLVHEGKLEYQVMLLIGTGIVPSLTYSEADYLYQKMVLDAYRIPLISDLQGCSTGFLYFNKETKDKISTLITDCKNAQSLKELDVTLIENKKILSSNAAGFFSMNESKCKETIDKHLPRIQALTGKKV